MQCCGSASVSGSVSHKYGSGSGSFHHQAKKVRKPLFSTVLCLLYEFLSLKNDVTVPVKFLDLSDPHPDP